MTIDFASFTPVPSLAGGLLIGLAAGLFLLTNGRIAGISGLLAGLLQPPQRWVGEKLLFLAGLVSASLVWRLAGALPPFKIQVDGLPLVIAGVLVGLGTRLASGCTSGHGVCGLARLSPRSLVATCCFMASGFITVFVIRHLIPGALV
jgi:uncharacterized membrane protein YedE/YeeE